MIFLLSIACQSPSSQSENQEKQASVADTMTVIEKDSTIKIRRKEQLRNASHVACIDGNNDGIDDPILFNEGTLFWGEERLELGGGVQELLRNNNTLWIGTGFGKEFRDAAMTLHKFEQGKLETIWSASQSRNQITDLALLGDQLYISTFSTGTNISGGWLTDSQNGKSIAPKFEANMAMQQKPLPERENTLIVGRLYGDEPRADGDLLLIENGTRRTLPNKRGVRTLEVTDINQDGHSDLLVADGWHYQYAAMGMARVQLYMGPTFEDVRTVAIFEPDYTINNIEVHQNGQWLLVQGTQTVYLLTPSPYGWQRHRVAPTTESGSSTFCYDKEGSYILVAGTPSTLYAIETP